MPKCRIIDTAHTWGADSPARRPWAETVIYEAHVKGMTASHPEITGPRAGTFEGLGSPQVVEHLAKLGVTAIELMPIQSFFDDRYLVEKGLSNYWGYNTAGFFAPSQRFLMPGNDIAEFKHMVQRMHEAGIEVILDVVYNHTAEGNQLGRRCRSAASTTPATMCSPTTAATISTRRAAATPSTPATRASCRW